jgi:outer membrane protein
VYEIVSQEGETMMKRVNITVVCLFVLSMLVVPRAFALGIEVGVGYWKQEPSGTLSYQAVSPTDTLDLKNDLNLGDKSRPYFRVKAELPIFLPNIYFLATPMSFEGTGTLTRSFTYGGQTFTAGALINSKLKMDHYDLTLYYSIPLLKTATLRTLNIDLGLNGRKIDFEATLTQPTTGVSSTKDRTFYVPMLYAAIQFSPVKAFSIEAEGRGAAYGSNHYYDFSGSLKIKPFGPLYISGGYRSETLKIDESDVKADVKFQGPFVEAGLSF